MVSQMIKIPSGIWSTYASYGPHVSPKVSAKISVASQENITMLLTCEEKPTSMEASFHGRSIRFDANFSLT